MNRLTIALGLVLVACITALWVNECSGPSASVDGAPVVVAPEQPGQPYRVSAAIRNTGPGHGEVEVTFSLRDVATGQTYQRTEHAQLEARSVIHIAVEIPAEPGSYQPSVEVQYPPG